MSDALADRSAGAGGTAWAGRRRGRRVAAVALGLVAAAAVGLDRELFGVAGLVDDNVSACKSLVLILNPSGSTFDISWTDEGEAGNGVVKVLYTASPPGLKPRRRSLACQFDTAGGGLGRRRLLGIVSDGAAIGGARVALLNRFWLRSRDMAAPIPKGPPDLPRTVQPADAV